MSVSLALQYIRDMGGKDVEARTIWTLERVLIAIAVCTTGGLKARSHFLTLLASILIAVSSMPVVNALSTGNGFSMPR